MTMKRTGLLVAALLLGSMAIPALGQAAPPGGAGAQGNQGGRQGRGNFDPAAMQQRMLDRIKQAMGSTDDEFAALSPKIVNVMTAQRAAQNRGGGFGGRQRGGQTQDPNAAPAAPAQPTSAVAAASKDLQTVLDNKDSKPEDIKAKLTALRDAKTAAKADLVKAQTDLREVITVRQEAVLVTMGYLE